MKYRVLNPHGFPAGVPIFTFREVNYLEGQVFASPEGLNPERLLRQGYIVEVADG